MLVAQILKQKSARMVTVRPDATINEAVETLKREGIGAVMVVDEAGDLAGILSERDVVRAMPAKGAELFGTQVGELMTREVVTCEPNERVRGVFSLAYPEVKQYFMDILKEGLEYGSDAVYLDCARTHASANMVPVGGWWPHWANPYLAYGYNEPDVARYRGLYGEGPPTPDTTRPSSSPSDTTAPIRVAIMPLLTKRALTRARRFSSSGPYSSLT